MSVNLLNLLLIVPALLGWWAQARVRNTYRKFSAQPNAAKASGESVGRSLLEAHGLGNVSIRRVEGTLTDHYNPEDKTLNLTAASADGVSVTALGVVAHEVGHAIQDAEGYRFLRWRNALARPLSRAASWSTIVYVGGMLVGIPILRALGLVMLAGMTVFAIVTLPVERGASARALRMLEEARLTGAEEQRAVSQVLRAAAFTYLTGTGQRIAYFLFFIALALTAFGSGGG